MTNAVMLLTLMSPATNKLLDYDYCQQKPHHGWPLLYMLHIS